MRFMLRFSFPVEAGNEALKDPNFPAKIQQYLTDIKAEAAYFSAIDGQRGAFLIVNMDDMSLIPSICEPLFLWLKADVEFFPIMLPQDLAKAGPAIGAAVKKWG